MAWYYYEQFLRKATQHAAYDTDKPPGHAADFAGIYRCMGCGREIGIAAGHILPPQTHHAHTEQQGAIRWRLIVYADHRPAEEQK